MTIKYADLKVGYDCNNDCVHCVISDQRKRSIDIRGNTNRTTNECYKEILSAKKNGCTSITITGGEPTIRSDFKDIVKFAKKEDFEVTLQSNGRKFSNQTFLDDVKDYIDFYMIALCGPNEEIHEKITQRKNSFDEVILALKNLVKIDVEIGVKIVISKHNSNDLLNIIKLAKDIGIKYCNIAFPHANGNALKYFDNIVPYYKDIKNEILKCIQFADKEKFSLDFEAILPCALDVEFKNKYFADLKISNNNGELRQLDEGLQDWNKVRKLSKRKGAICSKCIYNIFCEGYWKEYVEKRGFDEFKAITKYPEEVRVLLLEKIRGWKKE
jgi:MoaA/NifB/PqqE/SkfB family radical SAM enzyme